MNTIRMTYEYYDICDIDRLNAMVRKARRWGITAVEYDMYLLSTLADSGLCKKMYSVNHCLNHLLPKIREVNLHNLRDRPTRYILPRDQTRKTSKLIYIPYLQIKLRH